MAIPHFTSCGIRCSRSHNTPILWTQLRRFARTARSLSHSFPSMCSTLTPATAGQGSSLSSLGARSSCSPAPTPPTFTRRRRLTVHGVRRSPQLRPRVHYGQPANRTPRGDAFTTPSATRPSRRRRRQSYPSPIVVALSFCRRRAHYVAVAINLISAGVCSGVFTGLPPRTGFDYEEHFNTTPVANAGASSRAGTSQRVADTRRHC